MFQRILLITLSLVVPRLSIAQDNYTPAEYKLKGVFLFNFLQFTEWPTTAFENESAPLVIGILGEDPFGSYLDSLVANEQIKNRPIVLKRYSNLQSMGKCHLLFICKELERDEPQIFRRLRTESMLTVGETSQFAEHGGMIRLYIDDNKIRMQINVNAIKEASLTLSSKLLRLASICC